MRFTSCFACTEPAVLFNETRAVSSALNYCWRMRLVVPEGYLDFDLDLFWDVAEPLNSKVQELLAIEDPEILLLYEETIEQLLGVALASAQVYISAVSKYHGVAKDKTLVLGPTHASGRTIASLVNHGANFWKHADDWDWDSLTDRATRIIDAFHDLDAVNAGAGDPRSDLNLLRYVSNLTESGNANLDTLRRLLERWRTAVEQSFPARWHDAT
jgi:hypothetical protein